MVLKSRLFYYPKEEGSWYDMTMEKPHSITYDMINSLEVKSDAQFILVVEKVEIPIPSTFIGRYFQTVIRR